MKNSVMLRDELVKRTGVTNELIIQIEAVKVIKPMGLTDEKIPFYREEAVEQVNYIKKMTDLGYSMDEVQKVIKKVGFPKNLSVPESKTPASKHLTIGDLAAKVGVSARTLKHWEEKGIIEADMRSSGGFRLYSEVYVYLCNLIKDLQLFGYSLEQIKEISEQFRDFLVMEKNIELYSAKLTCKKLDEMSDEINSVKERMKLLKSGIGRWEELVNKKAKEIAALKKKNEKRGIAENKVKSKKEKVKSDVEQGQSKKEKTAQKSEEKQKIRRKSK
ncbi:MAG: MerR family transcriptional regulator [Acidobacteriota bacterium]